MNTHLNDGQLRAALDGEQTPAESAHLAGCETCQQRQSQLNAQKQRVAALFSPPAQVHAPNAHQALRRFHLKYSKKELPMFKKLFASSVFRYSAIVVLLIAVTFSFPQTRALAGQLLNLFRVQQVKVLPLDFSGMQYQTDQGTMGDAIGQMLSDSITSSSQPQKPVSVDDAAQASQLAGFTVRLPVNNSPAKLSVQSGGSLTFTINQEKAQAILNEAGRTDLQLPASIHGKDVTITIPTRINALYGTTCPSGEDDAAATELSYEDCIVLAEIPSPTVNAPAELNVNQLAQIGLEFTGMSTEEAAAYAASVDWTTTLVLPIPSHASYQDVSVDGVTGTLIEQFYGKNKQGYSLVWVKDGVIYSISGQGDSAKALLMANSIP